MWLRVSLLRFGVPAGQIAVMHRIIVDEKKWVSEGRFLHALNYCMLLPGPEAQPQSPLSRSLCRTSSSCWGLEKWLRASTRAA